MVDVATKKRGTEVVTDMLRSLALVVIVIAGLWFLIPHHAKQTVSVIDYRAALSETRRVAHATVVAPQGLPATWRATSASGTGTEGQPVEFHLGFLTPSDQYAAIEQSTGPRAAYLATLVGKAPQELAPVRVGALSWRQVRGADGRLALISPSTPVTVVVKGTASSTELATLAASLR